MFTWPDDAYSTTGVRPAPLESIRVRPEFKASGSVLKRSPEMVTIVPVAAAPG